MISKKNELLKWETEQRSVEKGKVETFQIKEGYNNL